MKTNFSIETIKFLFELRFNNNREWFQKNKERYLKYVLLPFKELVKDLGQKMLKIDSQFEIAPEVDKTISRIYRDTRFSKDKSPYRANVWISFKRKCPNWKETPTYFFEIYPEYYHFGMGFFYFPVYIREKLRNKILENPDRFKKLISFYQKGNPYTIEGEILRRTKDKNISKELKVWYERKELYLYCKRDIDDVVFSDKIVDFLYEKFLLLAPLYKFLWGAIS